MPTNTIRSQTNKSVVAHKLDDLKFLTQHDPSGMLRLTCEFPNQCRRALEISKGFERFEFKPANVILTGLGGSAAGGDFVRELFFAQSSIPFLVNRDYTLPAFAGPNTLVIVSSYSGNTEETLSAYEDAERRGCRLIAVTSGGAIAERAKADGVPLITIPGGQPPRTALGYMFVPVVWACEALDLIPAQPYRETFDLLDECVSIWGNQTSFDSNPAKQLALAIQGSVPILYGLGGWQFAVANRWKGQINENSKNMCFANAFPELNHNEILGWVRANAQNVDRWSVVLLGDGHESAKIKARARVTSQLIADRSEISEATARGMGLMQKMLSLVLLGDFVSLYLAALNEIDPENIDWINLLKSELAKVG